MLQLAMPMRLGALLLGLALVATPATGMPEGSSSPKPTTAAKASKLFKKMASKAAKECKLNLKDVAQDACEQIDLLRDELGEIPPSLIVEGLLDVLGSFQRESLAEVALTQTLIVGAAQSALLNYFEPSLPPGFITGDCGTIDKLNSDLDKELQKTTKLVMKKIKKLVKDAAKSEQTAFTASITPPDPPAHIPEPALPTVKDVELDSAIGANDNIEGVSGQVCFGTGHGDDPLAQGNYTIEIDMLKGDESITIPGGTVGVPGV